MHIAGRHVVAIVFAALVMAGDCVKILAAEQAASAPLTAKIGEKVPAFTFKDIRYVPRQLADFGEKKAYVLALTTLECPIVQRYLPRLKELDDAFRDKGVQFVAVNVGPHDDLREIAYQAIAADCQFPFVKDFDGQVARGVGATRAAQVVVLDADHKLRYRGRIDDQFRLGGERPTATREDLKLAIEAVLSGAQVVTAETAVDGCLIHFPKTGTPPQPVTYAEQIAPLLQKHCQDCHHDGNPEAPFALASYDDAVNHAPMIAETVTEQRMPPWYASRQHGEFTNYRGLNSAERTLIAQWVAGECQPGDLQKAPPPRVFSESKWKIGEPNLVLKTGVQRIPATGFIDYRYALLPYIFTQDTWIQGAQILPENNKVMHHCNMAFISAADLGNKPRDTSRNFITGQVPGGDPFLLDNNVGFKIPAGSVLVLQIHYVTVGQETTDQISIGLNFARETIQKSLKNIQGINHSFAIPPGDAHHKVTAVREIKHDITGYGLYSHMHVRGADMTFRALLPDGKEDTLLVIPNYNFNWQQAYRWPEDKIRFPKGTKLEVTAHYDNSKFNPYNPDPNKTIREGQQTFDEMMYGFMFYTEDDENLNLVIDPQTGHVVPQTGKAAERPSPNTSTSVQ